MLADAVATYLDGEGLVDYRPTTAGGDCFIGLIPSGPDRAVVLADTGGEEGHLEHGYDMRYVQARVRSKDLTDASDWAYSLYDELIGLRQEALGSTYLVACWSFPPGYIGQDKNGRHEFTMNMRLEVRAKTTHRE